MNALDHRTTNKILVLLENAQNVKCGGRIRNGLFSSSHQSREIAPTEDHKTVKAFKTV